MVTTAYIVIYYRASYTRKKLSLGYTENNSTLDKGLTNKQIVKFNRNTSSKPENCQH